MRIDLKRRRKDLYQPGHHDFVEVEVPTMAYLSIEGSGDPNTSAEYASAVPALYTGAYAVRFAFTARTGDDFVVGPLEGLWSSDDPTSFTARRKGEWRWTMLIPLPDAVGESDITAGLARAADRRPALPVARVRPIMLTEGRCLQILHIGPYDTEAATLARLHGHVMPARGLTWNGPHHEIYLSDPRKSTLEKLRTVLRQPVKPAS